MKRRLRVAVALSGGVDSAVSAALLKQEGYDVVGLFAKTWTSQPGDGTICTWVNDRRDALRVAAQLEIPLMTVDAEDLYRKDVLQPLLQGYALGQTPNSDVACNRVIKFGGLYRAARALQVDRFATGHYARIEDAKNTKHKTRNTKLLRGVDPDKDQSYFLWDMPREVLPHVLFPIGHLTKPTVRTMAANFGLSVADKPDSQGICFLGQTNMQTFLARQLPDRPGLIRDAKSGRVVGCHRGVHLMTIGQRHGFGQFLPHSSAVTAPRYVVWRDGQRREVWVGPAALLETREFIIDSCQWLMQDDLRRHQSLLSVQIRYRGQAVPSDLTALPGGRYRVLVAEPVIGLAIGQSAVFYADQRLLGGGRIAEVARPAGISDKSDRAVPARIGAE